MAAAIVAPSADLLHVASAILDYYFPIPPSAHLFPSFEFVAKIVARCRVPAYTLQVALLYLVRFRKQLMSLQWDTVAPASHPPRGGTALRRPLPPSPCLLCGRRMFLVSVIVATKYLDDRNVSLRSWSRTSGLTPAELRFEEVAFMNTLNHHLWISEMTWSSWQRTLTNDAAPWGAFLPRRDPDTLVPPASTITVSMAPTAPLGKMAAADKTTSTFTTPAPTPVPTPTSIATSRLLGGHDRVEPTQQPWQLGQLGQPR
ncbi:hypothetical protein CXG81DRAFT_28103 [Caulochytrium protostelioides]|uniref:Cyclin N-terminal domain-containing protein n=1 Tax=Caulochytrium protostelioides TaxID=1555241 RepID=A0A4P9X238_9FUNG|nr:hypothetical protein CXG81DRAFT_28103 [Caulochytrium protostelioides]|eukprot:RKO99123.1 hypothetical protein CXG81DRAFT_28103 [Caulochytrium protostelioides]